MTRLLVFCPPSSSLTIRSCAGLCLSAALVRATGVCDPVILDGVAERLPSRFVVPTVATCPRSPLRGRPPGGPFGAALRAATRADLGSPPACVS